jgi:REP element-mobilizing transposase RayT
MDYWERKRNCEQAFLEGGPFFIVTTENLSWLLFTSDQDFMDGTNMVAVALSGLQLRILNEVVMNNHLHFLLEGPYEQVLHFTERFRKAMSRYQLARGNPSLAKWDIQIKAINDLRNLQNAILYISRNPSVAGRDVTPVGYKWSSAQFMFNNNCEYYLPGIPFKTLTFREKRAITRLRDITLPEKYRVLDGMILRQSFVDYKRAEEFFESAHQYFRLLARRVESDAETARWLGESILLPNEDVFRIVADWYNVKMVSLLTTVQRLEAARRMKAELMSNNKQIAQVLRLPLEQIDKLFPVIR